MHIDIHNQKFEIYMQWLKWLAECVVQGGADIGCLQESDVSSLDQACDVRRLKRLCPRARR
jgi:hypothetical protein